jgi:hypothetical protein
MIINRFYMISITIINGFKGFYMISITIFNGFKGF